MAKGSEVIKTLLEKELYVFINQFIKKNLRFYCCCVLCFRDTLKLTKSNQLESIDGKKNKTVLGKKKKRFEFAHCPMSIEFAEVISTSQDVNLESIKDWLEKIQ